MNQNDDITLCLTIGKRPEELRRTLNSLFQFEQFEHVIAINDFGDAETSRVFREICPNGTLIELGHQVGHHKAVDYMYSKVTTPYIFHCEDDWLFVDALKFDQAKTLLTSDEISSVCFRKVSDFTFAAEDKGKIARDHYQGIEYIRLDKLHKQWHGFTFNPHLAKIDLWHAADRYFAQFEKERHLSRWQRRAGKHAAFMTCGACQHIGNGISVSYSNAPPSRLKATRRAIRSWIKTRLFKSK